MTNMLVEPGVFAASLDGENTFVQIVQSPRWLVALFIVNAKAAGERGVRMSMRRQDRREAGVHVIRIRVFTPRPVLAFIRLPPVRRGTGTAALLFCTLVSMYTPWSNTELLFQSMRSLQIPILR
jgi:hypothetical protein